MAARGKPFEDSKKTSRACCHRVRTQSNEELVRWPARLTASSTLSNPPTNKRPRTDIFQLVTLVSDTVIWTSVPPLMILLESTALSELVVGLSEVTVNCRVAVNS